MENKSPAFQLALLAAVLAFPSSLVAEDVIEFRLARKHLVIVPVAVNGQGPYDFLLDTGSTTTVLDRALAEDLDLEPLQHTVIRTATGTERVPIVRLSHVELGPVSTQTVLALSKDLRELRSLDKNLRGVLGFNFLSRFDYLLDYEARQIHCGATESVNGTRLPFDVNQRSIVLDVEGVRLLLDTGATSLYLFESEDGPAGLDIQMNRSPRRVSTATGFRLSRSGWLRALRVGDASFERVPVTLMPNVGTLAERADGLLPGAMFASVYVNHREGFVQLR